MRNDNAQFLQGRQAYVRVEGQSVLHKVALRVFEPVLGRYFGDYAWGSKGRWHPDQVVFGANDEDPDFMPRGGADQ